MIDSTVSASYLIGVTAAIIAGIAFNLGMVIQKLAVMKASHETSLLRMSDGIRGAIWRQMLGLREERGT